MKLFFTKGACSLVVRIIINELNLPCSYEAVDLKTKKTAKDADFLTINPKGSVPALEVKENEVLTENAIILQYLADTTPSQKVLPPIGNFKRYRVLEWVNFITTELHKTFANLFNPTIPQDIKDSVFVPLIKKKLAFVNDVLQNRSYLAGDDFTLPDAYLFVILRWAQAFKIDLKKMTNLENYFSELKKRESIAKSLQEEGL